MLDVGKSLSKLSAWTSMGEMVARRSRPNLPQAEGRYAALNAAEIGAWVIDTLAEFSALGPIRAIIPVSHGAGVAVLQNGGLATPPMDYEQAIPAATLDAYRGERDPFALTGSPQLPNGLNLGAQLYWLQSFTPEIFADSILLPWAQYWAWFLCGIAASEVTSLGCHTDLWNPAADDFSPMAKRLGWASAFAPIAKAGDALAPILPHLAARTGLSIHTQIYCGLHDSNAALVAARAFPEIADHELTVLSTGTWFVAMRTPESSFDARALPSGRDCLINVDVGRRAIPSARFMGGREIETLIGARRVDIKADQPALLETVTPVVASGAMVLPTLAPGTGPFPSQKGAWRALLDDQFERRTAACLYAALVADAALDLIGSSQTLLIEGRFAETQVFVRALASLRPHTRVFTCSAHADVSFGALRLINPELRPDQTLQPAEPLVDDLSAYAEQWRAATWNPLA